MMNLFNDAMHKLDEELERRGIVYEEPESSYGYGILVTLEGVYEWGFTTVMYSDVLEPIIKFYDWEYQLILSLDCDKDTQYRVLDGLLRVTEHHTFNGDKHEFSIRLSDGAPVHVRDIEAIGYIPRDYYADDKRFYALKDGRIYFKKDCEHLKLCESGITIEDFLADEYTLVKPDCYESNVNVLNQMLSRNMRIAYRR